MLKQITGQLAEAQAEKYLHKQGLKTLNKNFYCRFGELDLIMQDGEELVFVEVRHRNKQGFGSGAESITRSKQKKLTAAARYFLSQHPRGLNQFCRFDVVSIDGGLTNRHVNWIKNAITEF